MSRLPMTLKLMPDWMAEPAAEIVGGNPEFLLTPGKAINKGEIRLD